ncbi:MAG: flagellar biosynthetic protein FliO [Deltaproteobacteria bacterium]|nr:flagellar biosynthetic protein FliO [Deltaproteobacteria bacterium]
MKLLGCHCLLFLSFILSLYVCNVLAEEPIAESAKILVNDDSSLGNLSQKFRENPFTMNRAIRTILSLIFVCALAVILIGKVLPRLNLVNIPKLNNGTKPSRKRLKLIERLSLDRNNYLAIVSIDDKREVVIAVNQASVSLLLQVEPEKTESVALPNQ